MWYLRTFELSSPSVFSELGGMHYAPDNVADTMVLFRPYMLYTKMSSC